MMFTSFRNVGRYRLLWCALLVAAICVCTPALYGQAYYGSIVGTVTDSSGAIIPGARVTITNKSTNETHTATSNGAGEYSFTDLVPAAYSVQVEGAGFKRYLRNSVPVEVNTTTRVDASLQVGAVSETVEVSAAAVVLQTDSSTVSNKVDAQQVAELPLNGRNLMQLLNITAGVIPSSAVEQGATMAQNGGTSTNPLSWGGGTSAYTINGGDNEEYLDGAPINVLQGSNISLMPTADAIQEFNIDTNNYSAEEGRATGGVINETTKSGTNTWHGTAYEYFRNADLNANNFFNKRAISAVYPHGLPTPKYNQNLWGFNLGFPIKKDKIFFFGSYEVDDVLTQAPALSNEPTNDMRAGVFNGVNIAGGARQFFDPLGICSIQPYTGQPVNGTSYAAGGYYIANLYGAGLKPGTTCGDSTAKILQTYWAETPNLINNTTNYAVNISGGDVAPEMNARLDYIVSPKQRLFAHVAWWAPNDKPNIPYPNPNVPSALPNGAPWGLGSAVGVFNSNLYILGDTYTLSPKTVLDVRAVYLRFHYAMSPKVNNFDLSGLGPNWAQFNAYLPNGNHWLPSPGFGAGGAVHNLAATGFPTFGFAAGGQSQIWDTYGINASVTHIWGKHSVKAGLEARMMDLEVGPSNFAAGNPNFGIKYSNITNAATGATCSTCGDEWAEFLMGYFVTTTFSGSSGGTEFNYYQAYFASDTWQVTRDLTLNLGVRWELPGGLMEKGDSTLVLLPYTNDPYTGAYGTEALVNTPAAPSRSIFPIKHDLVDPRIGFAYRLDDKTVLRGGYGITTQAVDEDGGGNGTAGAAVNSDQLAWTNPTGGTNLPTALLQNPIPNVPQVYVPALHRSTPAFLQTLAIAAQTSGGVGLNGFWKNERLPYVQQYNLAMQHQFGRGFQFTTSYVGAHSVELHTGGNIDEIPYSAYTVTTTGTQSNLALGSQSPAQTATAAKGPYAGTGLTTAYPQGGTIRLQNGATQSFGSGVYCSPNGSFCNSNWLEGQTLQPYPNYSNATIGNLAYGNQNYNALQVTSQWRIPGGGLLGGAYTWAKTINDTSAQQDYLNHRADRSVAGVPMRFVANLNYPLPIGRGQRYLSSTWGPVNRVISGWALNDITSFQHGGYLTITATGTGGNQLQQHFGAGTTRPNFVPSGYTVINGTTYNCNNQKLRSGSAYSRLGEWFNVGCFQYPGDYSFGSESVNDPQLFAQGIENWDLALLKTTKVTERLNVQFRVESFNTFNHFEAGTPNTTVGNGAIGTVTSQANNPRQVQLSLRLTY